ncbi:MAG: malate synthase A, partial [Candidatus Eisenbacteria bacterium]|nr:malate synthase A [Candidatus Eisenbacteria bacterium]
LRAHPDRIQADRATISMNRPWMRDYAKSLVAICHRHGALAIGGMAAFTPGKNPASRQLQTDRVLEDKKQEYAMGHDGCWVSHPYFIGPALSAFPTANQLQVHPQTHRPDILPKPSDPRTIDGLRTNIRVGIAYMKGWQDGLGCVAWDDLMEDLATLEIARAQTWQWLHHATQLKGGETVTPALVKKIFKEELGLIERELPATFRGPDLEEAILDYRKASYTAQRVFLEEHFRPFLAEASELAT